MYFKMKDFMSQPSHSSLFTAVSCLVGGVGKAVTAKPLLFAITLTGLNIVLYAANSDNAGYVINKILDNLSEYRNNYFKENCKSGNE